ncbi:hypothetical protein BC938DRAFT_475796 [Jimgerdemannia flammicorona]|uniref:Uncharacterized protein n=1 Tax=Jimgerdemannia flammicorona TaxID=994334 RepID=A0A433PNQ4_9FUNG|nr:hypothetical protein BC938DRAFT_475796 [Jimgerdemannia flammicorona]
MMLPRNDNRSWESWFPSAWVPGLVSRACSNETEIEIVGSRPPVPETAESHDHNRKPTTTTSNRPSQRSELYYACPPTKPSILA